MMAHATVNKSPNCPSLNSPPNRQKQTHSNNSQHHNECWQNSPWWQCVHIHQRRRHGVQIIGCIDCMPKKAHCNCQMKWTWTIPHTIDPVSQAMATIQAKKESQKRSSTGQYPIRPAIHVRSHQVDACGLRISSQFHMDQSHQSRKLHRMANSEWTQRGKIVPRNHRKAKCTSKWIKEKFQFHQT